jgi:alkylation response protein AidB-like acyl-CoA dehydrogenase
VSGAAAPAGADWRAKAERFAREQLGPAAREIDATDRIPPELIAALAAEGFLGLGIPTSWGGQGTGAQELVAVLEEFAAVSPAIAVVLAVHVSVCAAPILEWGSEAQRRRYLPDLATGRRLGAFALTEPGAGSDAAALRTRYRKVDGGFELSGSKVFISNAASAGAIVLFATDDPANGAPGISAFIVPPGTAGFSVAQRFDKLGLRGSETVELRLDQVRLPTDALLGPEGKGLRVALSALAGGRVGIASCALGLARGAFEEMRRNVRADDADWKRHLLGRSYAELLGAQALVEEAARRKDAGAPFIDQASAAKFLASRAAFSIASHGIDVAGEDGATHGSAADRFFRDARVFPIVEGTTEIQELILARRLLEPPDGRTV